MAKRLSLAERFAQTKAAAPARKRANSRAHKAKLAELAPVGADAAISHYSALADKLGVRMAAAVERVYATHPITADKLAKLEADLMAMVRPMARNARAAAKRINKQARKEMSRVLGAALPPPDDVDAHLIEMFVDRNMAYYRKLVRAQVQALAAPETENQRPVRSRPRLIAKDQSWELEGALHQHWALRGGDDAYYWVTCRDDRVRPGHAALDGTLQRYSQPPNTGRKEGNNNPGQAVHCRCKGVPRSAVDQPS